MARGGTVDVSRQQQERRPHAWVVIRISQPLQLLFITSICFFIVFWLSKLLAPGVRGAWSPTIEYVHEHGEPAAARPNAYREGAGATRLHLGTRRTQSEYSHVNMFLPKRMGPGAATDGVLVCVPPKSGTTSFLSAMYEAMTGELYDPKSSCPNRSQTVWIHQAVRENICGMERVMHSTQRMTIGELTSLLHATPPPDVFSFALTRDPISRAISGYKSKVRFYDRDAHE